jgi:hypothetical protein
MDLATKSKDESIGAKRSTFKIRLDSIRKPCNFPDAIKAVTRVHYKKQDPAHKNRIKHSTENALRAIRFELSNLFNKGILQPPPPHRFSHIIVKPKSTTSSCCKCV